jgi:hypothetical protein
MIASQNNGDTVDRKSLCKDGETRRDVGMAFAAARRPDRVTLGRVRLLRALLASPDGTATIDDATTADELSSGFADGGKWRGSVPRSLVRDGFAVIVQLTRSVRPSRHRGYVAVLKLVDRVAAENYVQEMIAAFAAFNEATSPAGTDEAAKPNTAPNTTNEGVSNHEVI